MRFLGGKRRKKSKGKNNGKNKGNILSLRPSGSLLPSAER
jgi:hypothetical protein